MKEGNMINKEQLIKDSILDIHKQITYLHGELKRHEALRWEEWSNRQHD